MLSNFLSSQISQWPLAGKNYAALSQVQTRTITLDDFPIRLQFNPGRIASTTAKVKADEVKARPCFLCRENRPAEQTSISFRGTSDYEILVNPFPIAPEHFTIAACEHKHQDLLELSDMEKFASAYPAFVAFYNGSNSGASAPDHLHFQACRREFILPIVSMAEKQNGELIKHTSECDIFSLSSLPMHVLHIVSSGLCEELTLWLSQLVPYDEINACPAIGKRNIFMWRDSTGKLHSLLFPRAAHRPSIYYVSDEERMLVSPGALDMAGVVILPRKEDFMNITPGILRKIYNEVSLDYRSLPAFTSLLLR